MAERAKIRLYIDAALGAGQSVNLSRDHAHYLGNVMRQDIGALVALFNGRDGEWTGTLESLSKKSATVQCEDQTAPQTDPPDLWMLFAPIKKTRTDFIVEKAAELGAAYIQPVQTEFTNAERIRQPRLQAHAIEAAEQCGGTFVPKVADLQKLSKVLDHWNPARRILFCDETQAGQDLAFPKKAGPWAILIGPEGGFSDRELARLRGADFISSISLGPRILRADTAAVAALSLWQSKLGDW
ncbi:MAG: 16S rRNA (uracil(1498)-N(3))-methyltransferase [Pseudomonadota bacterium]